MVYDKGYHFVGNRAFSRLTAAGIGRIFDPTIRAGDPRTDGTIVVDGDVYHRALPQSLHRLPVI